MRRHETASKAQDGRLADDGDLPVLADLDLQVEQLVGVHAQTKGLQYGKLQRCAPDTPLPALRASCDIRKSKCGVEMRQQICFQVAEIDPLAVIEIEIFRKPVDAVDDMQACSSIEVQSAVERVVVEKIESERLQIFLENDTPRGIRHGGIFLGENILHGLDQGCHTVFSRLFRMRDIFADRLEAT